jgi:hypothetical protein
MVDAFRNMLDELMGKERDVPLGKRQNKPLEFDDPAVCKYELLALCPNRLFRNTKSDLGEHMRRSIRYSRTPGACSTAALSGEHLNCCCTEWSSIPGVMQAAAASLYTMTTWSGRT